jgi:hypothetical protein
VVPQLESSGNQPEFGVHTLKVYRTAQAKRTWQILLQKSFCDAGLKFSDP